MVGFRSAGVRHARMLGGVCLCALALAGCVTEPAPDDQPPVVTILSPADGAVFEYGTTVHFNGTGTDPEDGTLSGSSLGWTSEAQGPLGSGADIVRSDLQIGQHVIRFTGVDSKQNVAHAFITITIQPPNQPPAATIFSPAAGSVFQLGESIPFAGVGSDPEDGALSGSALVWASSIDGQLGTGASISRADLSAGVHTITLTVHDSQNASQSASVSVTVNAPPTVTIASPTNGSAFNFQSVINFIGSATDPDDGALSGPSLQWSSSRDGQLGFGTSISRSDLSTGTHTITLAATDSRGATTTRQVSITVGTGNQPPTAQITSPPNGTSYPAGALISFSGSASDPEDGTLQGSALVWKEGAVQLATGSAFATATLAVGQHTITLQATDSQGATGSAQVTISVQTVAQHSAHRKRWRHGRRDGDLESGGNQLRDQRSRDVERLHGAVHRRDRSDAGGGCLRGFDFRWLERWWLCRDLAVSGDDDAGAERDRDVQPESHAAPDDFRRWFGRRDGDIEPGGDQLLDQRGRNIQRLHGTVHERDDGDPDRQPVGRLDLRGVEWGRVLGHRAVPGDDVAGADRDRDVQRGSVPADGEWRRGGGRHGEFEPGGHQLRDQRRRDLQRLRRAVRFGDSGDADGKRLGRLDVRGLERRRVLGDIAVPCHHDASAERDGHV